MSRYKLELEQICDLMMSKFADTILEHVILMFLILLQQFPSETVY